MAQRIGIVQEPIMSAFMLGAQTGFVSMFHTLCRDRGFAKSMNAETHSKFDGECQTEQGTWAKNAGDGPEAGCALCLAGAEFCRVVRSYCDLA